MKMHQTIFNGKLSFILVGLITLLTFAAATPNIFAASGELDRSFTPTFGGGASKVNAMVIQPDGKVLIAGNFTLVQSQPRNYIARLNADGTVDPTFDSAIDIGAGGVDNITVNSFALQTDGKIIVVGKFNQVGGQVRKGIARLNSDGTLDPSFVVNITPADALLVCFIAAVQSDGKVLFTGNFGQIEGQTRNGFARVNANGSLDTAFNPNGIPVAYTIVQQPDGKILLGGSSFQIGGVVRKGVARLNLNGTLDTTFIDLNTDSNVEAIKLRADGKIYIGGQFTSVGGQTRRAIARINADGTLDASFDAGNVINHVKSVDLQADGKIVTSQSSPIRLNTDGSQDTAFNGNTSSFFGANLVAVQTDGKIVISTDTALTILVGSSFQTRKMSRLNADGTLEQAYNPYLAYPDTPVAKIAVQTDGKILLAGPGLVRVNPDGTLDTTFSTGSVDVSGSVRALIIQPDGKILAGLVRLNSNGTRDTSFTTPTLAVGGFNSVGLQPDGKILVGGAFITVNGQSRRNIVRLNSDGSIDASFNPNANACDANGNACDNFYISSFGFQTDGKIVVGGGFNRINGVARNKIARLNADGTLDTSFADLSGGWVVVDAIAIQADGKILIGGAGGTFVNPTRRQIGILRLNVDGTVDPTFNASFVRPDSNNDVGAVGEVYSIVIQPNNKILIGGNITVYNRSARSGFARLNADGSLDNSIGVNEGVGNTVFNTTAIVFSVALQADGKILVGGRFVSFNNVARSGVARLLNSTNAASPISDFDGDGRADASVFRNGTWFINPSASNPGFAPQSFYSVQFGLSTDKLTPADFDGDGKTDIAVWREGAFGYFYVLQSATNTFRPIQFGTTGDNPTVVGDWDGDGKADAAVYRSGASGGQSYFYYRPSSQPTVDFVTVNWGTGGDKPMRGDFDGDGKSDAAVFHPSDGVWYIRQSSNSQARYDYWGTATDKFVPNDYDGDGKSDLAVFRNGVWYIKQSSNGSPLSKSWGANTDLLVPADYDGDGKSDLAVYRNGVYYILNAANAPTYVNFGAVGDVPIASVFVQ